MQSEVIKFSIAKTKKCDSVDYILMTVKPVTP